MTRGRGTWEGERRQGMEGDMGVGKARRTIKVDHGNVVGDKDQEKEGAAVVDGKVSKIEPQMDTVEFGKVREDHKCR